MNKMMITKEYKLKDINPELAETLSKRLGMKAEDIPFIRKGIVPTDLQFKDGEKSVVCYITTKTMDRDGEIVDPDGIDFSDYQKNPVVLWCHDYKQLPMGKSLWMKKDDVGVASKTLYANHAKAQEVYQYRKDGFPLAESIGFVPLEIDEKKAKAFGCRRYFSKSLMLEYSDVPVPSNPDAIQLAVSKGLITDLEAEEFITIEEEDHMKEFETAVEAGLKILKEGAVETEKEVEAVEKIADSAGVPSISDVMSRISDALQGTYDDESVPGKGGWCIDCYPVRYPDGHCIVAMWADNKYEWYQTEYVLADDGVVFGEFKEVEARYMPTNAVSIVQMSLQKAFEDMAGITEKEGRVLSGKNRTLIQNAVDALGALLEATQAAKGVDEEGGFIFFGPGANEFKDFLLEHQKTVKAVDDNILIRQEVVETVVSQKEFIMVTDEKELSDQDKVSINNDNMVDFEKAIVEGLTKAVLQNKVTAKEMVAEAIAKHQGKVYVD